MDRKQSLIWEAREDVPSILALIAFIGLWGFLTTAATIYCTTLGY